MMLVTKFCHKNDGVKSSVFGKSVGDEFEGFSVSAADIGVGSEDVARVHLELMGDLHLNAGSSGHGGTLLNEGSDDTKSIMEGSVGLIEDELVGSSEENRDGLSSVGASSDFNDLGTTLGDFVDEVGVTELLLGKLVDVGDGSGVDGSRDEVYLVAVDVLNDHHVLLGQEMEGEVGDSLSEHGLLEEEDVGASGEDLLDELKDVFTLFLKESIHGSVIVDNDVGFEVRLGGGERELDESDLGLLDSGGATSEVRHLLVDKDESIDELGVINGATEFLLDIDVSEVDVVGGLFVDDLEDGIDGHGGEQVGVMRHDL